jgi:hypothetical protein
MVVDPESGPTPASDPGPLSGVLRIYALQKSRIGVFMLMLASVSRPNAVLGVVVVLAAVLCDSAIEVDEVVVVVVLVELSLEGRLCACAGSEKKASPSPWIPAVAFTSSSSSDIKPKALWNS